MTILRIVDESPHARVDPKIFGHFVEHMGRGVYGGIVDESGRPDEQVQGLVRALSPSVIRYPGGCFAAEYHWWEAVGEDRSEGLETFWSRVGLAPVESNRFGTDEFLDWCESVGAAPYFTANLGTGTPTEAAEWVRYTGGRVPIWSLGNEVFGPWETGHKGPRDYGRQAEVFADAMLARDPEISLVGVGADTRNYLGWNEAVLNRIGRKIKWLSLHFYAPGPEAGCLEDTRDGYLTVTAAPLVLAQVLDQMADLITTLGLDLGIALDEWAVWSCDDELRGASESGESSPMRDALFAAGVFNRLIERADRVTLACYAQLVNVLGLIHTEGSSVFTTPIYHVFRLYRSTAGQKLLQVIVEDSPVFEAPELGRMPRIFEVPFIDAAGVISDEGEVSLFLINRHPALGIEVTIAGSTGIGETVSICGDGPFARNSFVEPDRVSPIRSQAILPNILLAPHSVTRLKVPRLS